MTYFRILTLSSVIFASMGTAYGADAPDEPSESNIRLALVGGLTVGGDEIFELEYEDGSDADIRAGNLFELGGGLIWHAANSPIAVQTTLTYHFDTSLAENGDASFSRLPLTVTGYYTGVPKWRFGAGIRYVLSPEAELEVDNDEVTLNFDNALGGVIEVGYQLPSDAWINLRYVNESYELKSFDFDVNGINGTVDGNEEWDGSHVGINVLMPF